MTLRTKTLLYTILAMAGLIAALYLGTTKVLLQGFQRVESVGLQRQIGLVKFAFANNLNALGGQAREMSAQAGLYSFARGRAPAFAQTGLNQVKLAELELDFVAVVNREGKVVFDQMTIAPSADAPLMLKALRARLTPESSLLRHQTLDGLNTEVIALPESWIYLVSSPILTPRYTGPGQGSLVVAKHYTVEDKAAFTSVGLTFALHPLNLPLARDLSAVVASLRAQGEGGVLERPESEAQTTGYTLLPDELGPTPFLLEVSIPRRIYAQALESRTALLWVVSGICGLFLVLMGCFFNRVILSRLQLLSQGVQRVAQEGSATKRLEIPGNDEFAKLASDTNHMLSALEAAQREAQVNAERYALVAEGVNDGIWDLDAATEEMHCSPRLWSMLGYSKVGEAGLLKDHRIRDHIHPDDLPRVDLGFQRYLEGKTHKLELEFRVCPQDGAYHWMLLRGAAQYGEEGRLLRIAGSLTDLTRRGLFDALTGLPNRLLLREQLTYALQTVPDSSKRNALLLVNVNRFRAINESLGHDYGDLLLIEIAKRLQAVLRPTDSVARLGGDEFAVLLESLTDAEALDSSVKRLMEVASTPFVLEAQHVTTSLSLGVVADLSGYSSVDDVLRDADSAMHHAKAARLPLACFDKAMLEDAKARLKLEADLRQALERGELSLVYQPIVSLTDSALYGVEALLRWQHPTHGAVSPAVFIPLAEETGLIVALGEWVLREACRQTGCLNGSFSISVNLSSRQFNDALVERVVQILEETGLPPQRLVLEVTESALVNDALLATDILAQLRTLGVRTALDDFGTGYSSLSYLSDLPLNILKIDRTFVARLLTDSKSVAIVQAIVGLSQVMALKMVAEGVETEEQVTLLRMLGCHYVQGYYFYRPLTLGVLRELTERTAG